MDAAHVAALWLHSLAMVIVIGYYAVFGRIVLPALSRTLDPAALRRAIPSIERRALPIVLVAILAFIVTGSYLLVIDDRYAGLGNLFATDWTTLLFVKHLVVFVMILLGVGIDRLAAGVGDTVGDGEERTIGILGLATDGMVALGAIVLLLTAMAQLS